MILLDTHIWFWFIALPERLSRSQLQLLESTSDQLCVSAVSLLEIARLVSVGKIKIPIPIEQWFPKALEDSSIRVIDLTREIIIESTRLPGEFHRDPADQIIVATSRVLDIPLMTSDKKILGYQHVNTLP